jgi:hypothetical protein
LPYLEGVCTRASQNKIQHLALFTTAIMFVIAADVDFSAGKILLESARQKEEKIYVLDLNQVNVSYACSVLPWMENAK